MEVASVARCVAIPSPIAIVPSIKLKLMLVPMMLALAMMQWSPLMTRSRMMVLMFLSSLVPLVLILLVIPPFFAAALM